MGNRRKSSAPVPSERRKANRRGTGEDGALGRATSITAAVAPHVVPGRVVREEDIKIAEQATEIMAAVPPGQPTLFEMLDPGFKPQEKDAYSLTTDLYDATPRFWLAKNQPRVEGKYLPLLHRDFEHQGHRYHMELAPAQVSRERKGVQTELALYPGTREEVIEMELVQMAAENGVPWINHKYGVQFTLRELHTRLKTKGHDFNLTQLKEGLFVLSGCVMTVTSEDGTALIREPLLRSLGLRTWDEWAETGSKTLCAAAFNSLQLHSLRANTWRLYDEVKTLQIHEPLARWMYRRMSREWIGASAAEAMKWKLTSIIRDSGMQVSKLFKARQEVEDALDRLKENIENTQATILSWTGREEVGGERGTLVLDVVYEIYLSLDFCRSMTRRNQLKRDGLLDMQKKQIRLPPEVKEE